MRTLLFPVLVAALTACSSVPTPLTAQDPAPDPDPSLRTVQVNANASVQRAPDRATVMLAVETLAETARAATDANARAMNRVISAVRELGIDPSAIRTQRIDLHPRYDQRREERAPRIVAYQAVNQVEVRVDDLELVGPVVDAAVTAGANRVNGIRFEVSDPAEAYHEALREAVAKARAEAGVLASALGETLGPPLDVSTTGGIPRPFAMARMEAERADAMMAPPVSPGELEIRASVTVVWRLGT